MKTAIRLTALTVVVLVLALPSLAQDRGRPGGGTSTGASSAGSASVGASSSSRGVAGGVSMSSPGYSATVRNTVGGYGSGGGYVFVPAIPMYSSFNNYNYYSALRFFDYMQMRYGFFNMLQYGLWDRDRFYRNREPLVTPGMVQMTLRQPLRLSELLLADIEALEVLVSDLQAGKPVSGKQIESKAQEIRELAKRIRGDESLQFFDPRKARDITEDADRLGLGAIARLREMALELNSQLRNMVDQKTTTTVSVNTLNQASFQSLSKGIEKLSKVVENAKPRT
jgi:hypothetical protein